jgi:hypothetical protein
MLPASNVVGLSNPARAAFAVAHGEAAPVHDLGASAARVWQLQLELAWCYPRFCYAVWNRLMRLER